MDQSVVPYRIPKYVLANDETEFIRWFFESLFAFWSTEHLIMRIYHLQTNEQAEHFNKRVIARLWHYEDELQRDWEM